MNPEEAAMLALAVPQAESSGGSRTTSRVIDLATMLPDRVVTRRFLQGGGALLTAAVMLVGFGVLQYHELQYHDVIPRIQDRFVITVVACLLALFLVGSVAGLLFAGVVCLEEALRFRWRLRVDAREERILLERRYLAGALVRTDEFLLDRVWRATIGATLLVTEPTCLECGKRTGTPIRALSDCRVSLQGRDTWTASLGEVAFPALQQWVRELTVHRILARWELALEIRDVKTASSPEYCSPECLEKGRRHAGCCPQACPRCRGDE